MSIIREVVISGEEGLHARPAAEIVRTLRHYASRVWLMAAGKRVDAKSVLMVMALAVKPGATVVIEADGEDEEAAAEALVRVLSGLRAE